jgi:hypothetical protein
MNLLAIGGSSDIFSYPKKLKKIMRTAAFDYGEQRMMVKKSKRTFKMKSLKLSLGLPCPYMSHRMSSGTGERFILHY